MLSTKELEKNIKTQIHKVLPDADLSLINFCDTVNNAEGIYVYYENEKYHYVITERGKIISHLEENMIKDILWDILDIILFDIAVKYELANRVKGKDFRRLLFQKELELYAMFGDEFKEKKLNEINRILLDNPYNDNL